MLKEIIKDIPSEKLQEILTGYQSEGYQTKVENQANGLYTVIATK